MSGANKNELHSIVLKVNGEERNAIVESRTTLADCLRDELGLTGTHTCCEHGVCGACTVLLDGHTASSCLMLEDRKSVVSGKSVSVRVDLGGRRMIKKKKTINIKTKTSH